MKNSRKQRKQRGQRPRQSWTKHWRRSSRTTNRVSKTLPHPARDILGGFFIARYLRHVLPSIRLDFRPSRVQSRLVSQVNVTLPSSDSEPKRCSVCGGKLVVEVLNYWWDLGPDTVSPADTKETCLNCGKVEVQIASVPPWR